jgi:hypothetical protein
MNKKINPFLSITLIVLIAVLLSEIIYFYEASQEQKQVKMSTIKVSPISDNLSWEKYVNKDLSFEISHPSSWIIDEKYKSEGLIWLRTESRQEDLDNKEKPIRVFDVEVKIYNAVDELPNNEQDKLSFEGWINKKADGYGFIERSPSIVDGMNGYTGVTNGETYGNYLQLVNNKNKIYEISIEGIATKEKMAIVKSFKFIK